MIVKSFAQNFEDVLLNRVFRDKRDGFYIDVGAAHPEIFSVTKWFYDLGWHGINIEPVPYFYKLLVQNRERDINLDIALGSKKDVKTFYESNFFESSSFNKDYAINANSFIDNNNLNAPKSYRVNIHTLSEICEKYVEGQIDFLKIDVEGFEKEVLEGADFKKYRPTIIVVEATIPNSGIDPYKIEEYLIADDFENILLGNNYKKVYFDGLNNFYLNLENEEYEKAFSIPVNLYEFTLPKIELNSTNRKILSDLQKQISDR